MRGSWNVLEFYECVYFNAQPPRAPRVLRLGRAGASIRQSSTTYKTVTYLILDSHLPNIHYKTVTYHHVLVSSLFRGWLNVLEFHGCVYLDAQTPRAPSVLRLGRAGAYPPFLNSPPSTLNPQPSTLNPQPATRNPQTSTRKPQPSTLNPQPSILIPQPSQPQPSSKS